ncbi:MAG: hypothetical protein HQL91_10760 [Magnetococcales bacterium]|nr:hypothetical protein [Magnetococcales bacterium]
MPTAALPFIDPGPFDRITGFSASTPNHDFALHVFRDDGLHYTPEAPENVDIVLFSDSWDFLFQGSTIARPQLNHQEAAPGLIRRFTYAAPHYVIAFNKSVLEEYLQRQIHEIAVYLITNGERTLETLYPRQYDNAPVPFLLLPGNHDIRIPFWEESTETTHPDQITTTLTTQLRSSVPFRTQYSIGNAIAMARFRFPILAVTWSPNPTMTGWSYDLNFNVPCSGIELFLPPQTIVGLTPPNHLPASYGERVKSFYNDLILILGVGACSTLWSALRVAVTTSFDYTATIPFAPSYLTAFNDTIEPDGLQPPNLPSGSSYSRTHRLEWNSDHLPYSTGHWPIHYDNQAATLEQSPFVRYDALHFQPQPE